MKIIKNTIYNENFSDDLLLSFNDDVFSDDVVSGDNMQQDTYNLGFVPDDDVFEVVNSESDSDVPSPPQVGDDTGVATQLSALIKDEWEAVDGYNSTIATLASLQGENYSPIIKILTDIVNEENIHIGQLESALKLVSPNAESINLGQSEAQEQIGQVAHPFMQVQSHTQPEQCAQYDDNPYTTQCTIADIDDTF